MCEMLQEVGRGDLRGGKYIQVSDNYRYRERHGSMVNDKLYMKDNRKIIPINEYIACEGCKWKKSPSCESPYVKKYGYLFHKGILMCHSKREKRRL